MVVDVFSNQSTHTRVSCLYAVTLEGSSGRGLVPERPGHDEKPSIFSPQLLQRGKGAGNGVNDPLTGFRELPGGRAPTPWGPSQLLP